MKKEIVFSSNQSLFFYLLSMMSECACPRVSRMSMTGPSAKAEQEVCPVAHPALTLRRRKRLSLHAADDDRRGTAGKASRNPSAIMELFSKLGGGELAEITGRRTAPANWAMPPAVGNFENVSSTGNDGQKAKANGIF